MNKYIWENFKNPKLIKLRKENKLSDLIHSSENEFEAQLKLKDWVHAKLKLGTPSKNYSNLTSFEIIEDAKKDKKFFCTQFAQLYIQGATSLGWYSRKLGIDKYHEKNEIDMHHGISDIWSDKFKKWYVIDAMHNLHYEKNNKPLNALEIRIEYLNNYAKDVVGIIGAHKEKIIYTKESFGFNTPSNYFWFFVSQRNNFFEKPGIFSTKAYLWVDKFNHNKTWFKESQKHPMYKNQFIETDNLDLVFPKTK